MASKEKPGTFLVHLRNLSKAPIILIGLVVLVCSAIFIGYKLYQVQVLKPWNKKILKQVDINAHTLATEVANYMTGLETRLKLEAQQETLVQALLSGDKNNLTEAQNHLLGSWPLLKNVALVKNLEDYPSYSENFVAADLLHQAGLGKTPAPVAIKLDGEWAIYIATPVRGSDDSNVAGSLLATFSRDVLKTALGNNPEHLGLTKILQSASGFSPQTIISLGSSSMDLNQVVPVKTVQGWQLSYTATTALIQNTTQPRALFLSSLSGVALLTIAFMVLLVRLNALFPGNIGATLTARQKTSPDDLSPEELNEIVREKLLLTKSRLITKATQPDGPGDTEKYPTEVFRDYDIRGQALNQITVQFAEALGKTLGSNAITTRQSALAVAADGRTTSPELHEALVEGILSTGCDVIDLGCIPTPVFNFGLHILPEVTSGVIVTASHNPPEDNGFKIIIDQNVMKPDDITQLAHAMSAEQWHEGNGNYHMQGIEDTYCQAIDNDVQISQPLHVVVDCANGVMGPLAPGVLEAFGCQVTPMYCDVDGEFPNHAPDPSDPKNLQDLIAVVAHENADLGLAFDGDGDRLVAISATGRIVWPDELLMIYARDMLNRQPGAHIVFDVKSTRRLASLISNYGGQPVMCKTGHSNIRRKIQDTDAPLGGEYSGHIFFNDRWFGFDDGLYAAARLIEIMTIREQSLDEIIDSFERTVATPEIKIPVPDNQKFVIMDAMTKTAAFKDSTLNNLDGLRVEFADGWGLIRASNTSPSLTLRFEADNREALQTIQACFKEQISPIIPDTKLPF